MYNSLKKTAERVLKAPERHRLVPLCCPSSNMQTEREGKHGRLWSTIWHSYPALTMFAVGPAQDFSWDLISRPLIGHGQTLLHLNCWFKKKDYLHLFRLITTLPFPGRWPPNKYSSHVFLPWRSSAVWKHPRLCCGWGYVWWMEPLMIDSWLVRSTPTAPIKGQGGLARLTASSSWRRLALSGRLTWREEQMEIKSLRVSLVLIEPLKKKLKILGNVLSRCLYSKTRLLSSW